MLFRDQKPLVSISIPTYNGAKYIEDTLNCAINQSYTNIEIIITDDQSTDNTLEICNAFAAKDKRIKVFQNKINLGLLGNWCEVVDKTSKESDWIKFLFQDDLMEPNTVLKMINAALTHNVDFVLTDRQYIFENGTTEVVKEAYAKMPQTGKIFKRSKKYSPEETASLIAKNDFFQNCLGEPPCILFKKSKYSHSDYPTEFLQTIDYLFILEKILKDNFYFVNEKLIQFRIHSSSQTNKNAKEESLYKRIVVHYYERIKLFHFLLNHPHYQKSKAAIGRINTYIINKYLVYKTFHKNPNRDPKEIILIFQATELKDSTYFKNIGKHLYLKYLFFKFTSTFLRKKYSI